MISKYMTMTDDRYSTTSITIMSLALFYAYSVVTASLTFLQFSRFEVVGVSLMFLVILLGCARVFRHFDGTLPLAINPKNICTALLVTFILIMLFSWSGRGMWAFYVRPFPLIEAEIGPFSSSTDTAYHVSLIQSILNFGYPSIAQHGHPVTIYHVLSHYTDALILLVTGLDPYDSYGLLYHFKIFIFLSSALVTITTFTQRQGLGIYLISVGLLIPPIVGAGQAIGSHGLWTATVLLLLSAPLVFSTLLEVESVSARRLASIFIVIVLIAFAKISSGFMLAMVVGAILLGMHPTKPSTYVFGVVVLGFFYGYSSLFGAKPPDISKISFGGLYNYFLSDNIPNQMGAHTTGILTNNLKQIGGHTTGILTSIFIIGTLFLSRIDRINGVALFSSVVAALALYFVTIVTPLSYVDILYFQYGLSSVLLLMSYMLILRHWEEVRGVLLKIPNFTILSRSLAASAVVALALLTKNFTLPDFNVFNAGPENISVQLDHINNSDFLVINSKLPKEMQLSLWEVYLNSSDLRHNALTKLSDSRPILNFRQQLFDAIESKGLSKNEVAMFVPSAIFDSQIIRYQPFQAKWASGLFLYAITGVQLVNGVISPPTAWGFASYVNDKDALRTSREKLSLASSCERAKVSHIALVTSFDPPQLEIVSCP